MNDTHLKYEIQALERKIEYLERSQDRKLEAMNSWQNFKLFAVSDAFFLIIVVMLICTKALLTR